MSAGELTIGEVVGRRAAARPRRNAVGSVAVVLLLLGIVFAGLYRIADGSERHSYNAGALAPDYVHVTAGKQYEISTPGGVPALLEHGVAVGQIMCSYRLGAGSSSALSVTSLGASTRTVHAVGTFIAPVTGAVHIDCLALTSGVFVDDADDAAPDPAGAFILVSTISFTLGAALGLSALYRRSTARRGKHDQVERGVDVGALPAEHGEVLGPDGGDVAS